MQLATLSIASNGIKVLKNHTMTSRVAPAINAIISKNIESLAIGLEVFAPATVKTAPRNAAITPAEKSHI